MLKTLIKHFGSDEHSKIYVLYSTHDFFEWEGKRIPIVTALPRRINSMLSRWTRSSFRPIRWLFDYRNLMFFYPLLCWLLRRKIQRNNPDHLVISSFATAKNIVPTSWWGIRTTLYVHSPMQYIWENYDEYMKKLTGLKKALFAFSVWYLRPRDKKSRIYDLVYANSEYTSQCVLNSYGIASQVRYPTLDLLFFSTPWVDQPRNYFVYVGRLVRFIREVDLIIELCNEMKLPLLVLGSGPDETYVKSIAWPTVTFVWQVSEVREKIEIVKHARWLINLAKESCGIATMEALSLWVPVFWYAGGWSREIVCPEDRSCLEHKNCITSESWVLTTHKSLPVLVEGMRVFLAMQRNRSLIQENTHQQLSTKITP